MLRPRCRLSAPPPASRFGCRPIRCHILRARAHWRRQRCQYQVGGGDGGVCHVAAAAGAGALSCDDDRDRATVCLSLLYPENCIPHCSPLARAVCLFRCRGDMIRCSAATAATRHQRQQVFKRTRQSNFYFNSYSQQTDNSIPDHVRPYNERRGLALRCVAFKT